jgi:DNA-binding NarL/FixJ family response regulator
MGTGIVIPPNKKVIIPESHPSLILANDVNEICAPLFRYTKINHFNYEDDSAYITQKKAEGLVLLCKGRTVKAAARLKLSPRTIEDYINNIKARLNLYSKSQLIEFFENSHIGKCMLLGELIKGKVKGK